MSLILLSTRLSGQTTGCANTEMESLDGKRLPDFKIRGTKSKWMKKALSLARTERYEESEDNGEISETDSDTLTDSDSDSDSEYECTTCETRFSYFAPYKQHLKGKKHAKVMLRKKKEKNLLEEEANDGTVNGKTNADKLKEICEGKDAREMFAQLKLEEAHELVHEEFQSRIVCETMVSEITSCAQHTGSKLQVKKVEQKKFFKKVIPDILADGR